MWYFKDWYTFFSNFCHHHHYFYFWGQAIYFPGLISSITLGLKCLITLVTILFFTRMKTTVKKYCAIFFSGTMCSNGKPSRVKVRKFYLVTPLDTLSCSHQICYRWLQKSSFSGFSFKKVQIFITLYLRIYIKNLFAINDVTMFQIKERNSLWGCLWYIC